MTEPRDDSLDRLLRQTLRRTPDAGATPSCLDAETMAAWMDGGLSGAALAAAEAHAATCRECQARAAVMVRSETAEQRPAQVSSSATEGSRARKWLPWLVPLAAAALVAMAIRLPRRAQQPPTQESTVTLAAPAETAQQVPLSGPIGEPRQTPPQQGPLPAAAKETRPDKAENARADQDSLRATVQAPPAAPSLLRAAPLSPSAPPLPQSAGSPPPPAAPHPASPALPPRPAPATAVTGGQPVVTPAPSFRAPLALDRAAPETVIAEFQSPDVLAQGQQGTIGAAGGRGAAPAGGRTGADAGARGGLGQGQGVAGRVGGVPRAGVVAQMAPANQFQPSRWRVLASGSVERSSPPGAPWEPVAIGLARTAVTNGAAPSPLVCWLVGRNGAVFLTIDGRSFTRIMFPETVDLASVRATSARDATVTTTDGRTFATMDGGRTWSRN